MRPYRATPKDKPMDSGEFVYGWYVKSGMEEGHYLYTGKKGNPIWDIAGCYVKVHPSTVGQQVGLKDSEGKEIYEGDIIRYSSSSRTWMVEFCDGGWKTTELPWDEENEPANRYELFGWDIPCEIIGNIHTEASPKNK